MEVAMSLNSLVRLPLTTTLRTHEDGLLKNSLLCPRITQKPRQLQQQSHRQMAVVQAKGKRGMPPGRQMQRPPALPKIEDDGNPKFVIFIREATLDFWFPLSVVTGGTTAKIMIAAKDNFLGKYIYKDTLDRNLAAVIYRDEKEIQEMAKSRYRELRTFTNFRYGYKLVEKTNLRAALAPTNVIVLPTRDKLKTVLDDVKDFFGKAKESFGKLAALEMPSNKEPEETSTEKTKVKGGNRRRSGVKGGNKRKNSVKS